MRIGVMKLTQHLYNMLQEVVVTPQSAYYSKFRYYITKIFESIHTEEEMSRAMVCDSCLQIKQVYYNICIQCGVPIDVCNECMIRTRTPFSNNSVCEPCRRKDVSPKL